MILISMPTSLHKCL